MTRTAPSPKRSGVILLVVLGMLALFSILAMTFLLFTSQSRFASEAIARRESSSFDPQVFRDRAIQQVLAGTNSPGSAFWGHDLLGDYYGYRGSLSPDDNTFWTTSGAPETTVLRCLEPANFGPGTWSAARRDAFRPMAHLGKKYVSVSTRLYLAGAFALDDQLNGRVLTFEEGPLEGLPLLIVRYFGDHTGVAGAGNDDIEDELRLSGRIVLDVEPYLENLITIDDEVKTLSKWLDLPSTSTQSHPSVLFYSKGANNSWGGGPDSPYNAAAAGSDDVGYKFYVNGARLNGTGMGWTSRGGTFNQNQTARDINATGGADASVALMGNFGAYLNSTTAANLRGDANEPFDVPDYNDWFLAHFPVDASPTELAAPSFVRPAVINYVVNYYNAPLNTLTVAQLQTIHRMLVQCNLRPLHYNDGSVDRYDSFTGGASALNAKIDFTNPVATIASEIQSLATALATGPWDIDNDGDGINDSVWVDAGLPTATMPDGSRVKPMVAVRIEDLGGRIDINHAGRYADVSKTVQGAIAQALVGTYPSPTPESRTASDVPSGFGFGPAEIPLGYRRFDSGSGTNVDRGTFSESRLKLAWSRFDDGHGTFVPGQSGKSPQNYLLDNDLTGFFRETGRPSTHFGITHYGTPLDVWGRGRVAIGIFGQPLTDGFAATVVQPSGLGTAYPTNSRTMDERQNDPYEMASRYRAYLDLPYSESDLDLVLNRQESFSDRLTSIIQTDLTNRAEIARRGFTTRSESLEIPPTTMPAEWRTSASENANTWLTNHFLRILDHGHDPTTALNAEQMRFWALVAPELRLGQRLNLNRPIGNGIDTDGDGVVDDPQEILAAIESFYPAIDATSGSVVNTSWTTGSGSNFPADLTPEEISRNSRNLLARHLYCLAMFVTRDEVTGTTFDYRSTTTGHPATEAEYRAWRLAQWAVNVVDFRDGDSIMTAFEYDVDPYDGWDVDGNLNTTNDTLPDGTTPTPRGVVWGMEAPELLLTESLNFHDRRVKDSQYDSGDAKERLPNPATDDWGDGDDDVDQYRIPQGTTVLELFCPRSPQKFDTTADPANPWAAPSDLYVAIDTDADSTPDTRYLNLSAKAPDNNPVWRIGITPNHSSDGTAQNNDPQLSPVTRLQDPASSESDLLGAADVEQFWPQADTAAFPYRQDPAFRFDRVIWMTSQDPTAVTLPADSQTPGGTPKVFYSYNADSTYYPEGILLGGGQYAVIGSRSFTAIGSRNVDPTTTANYSEYASAQSIALTQNSIETRDTAGTVITPTYGEQIRDVVGIIASAAVPATWANAATTAPERIGVNISEPGPWETTYYPEPQFRLVGSDGTYPFDAYIDEEAPGNSLPDQPFDERAWAPLANDFTDGQKTGTRLNYKTAYLQRLADPTQAYNATTNPYITVDWMPLDLTVFNGDEKNEEKTDMSGTSQWVDRSDPNPFSSAPDERFATRYKNGVDFATYDTNGDNKIDASDSVLNEGMNHNNIYSYGTRVPGTTNSAAGLPNANFAHDLLNSGAKDNPAAGTASSTLGYLNAAFGTRWVQNPGSPSSQLLRYVGAPSGNPFPWITWNNRPFASPYEIMHVPMTSGSRLMMHFSTPAMLTTPNRDIYDPDATADGSPAAPQMYRGEFGHVFNYFDADADFSKSPNFGRILDWVGTPDPFDYRHEMIHPRHYLGPIQSASQTWPPEVNSYTNVFDFRDLVPFEILRPPFNWKPNSGRAGKINLNTLQSRSTFVDLMQPYSTIAETESTPVFWDAYVRSRRGYNIPATSSVSISTFLNAAIPTQFAGAFRPSSFAGVGPLIVNYDASTNSRSTSNSMQSGTPMSTGLLRPDPATATKPLFRRTDDTSRAVNNTRSQFHRNLGVTRLPNLTDSNSQVFAVWTTIGLFNIDANGDPSDEYGQDIGEDQRFQSFYIIDRTIPVRYEPGDGESAKRAIIHSRNLD